MLSPGSGSEMKRAVTILIKHKKTKQKEKQTKAWEYIYWYKVVKSQNVWLLDILFSLHIECPSSGFSYNDTKM